jgi:2-dehydro-3-deoxyphosphooctonate aldolase (KDO 8-P synthase)
MSNIFQQLQSTSQTFFLLAGPCVIESETHALKMAAAISAIAQRLAIPYVFKASYDKANRSSGAAFRGLGMEEGLRILQKIKQEIGVPVLTDVHESTQVPAVAEVADILQIPAFLCRQTDLLIAAAQSGRIVNVKKGQFLSPWDMKNVVEKLEANDCHQILLTERGSSFGYNNLVVDMRGLPVMRGFGYPVIYDATHSLQLPGSLAGGTGTATGGLREYIPHLARAAVACGIDGLFMEVHDQPEQALSDAATQFPLDKLPGLLEKLLKLHALARS